ncbi:MAG: YdeI/OmpD-associated family protein [Bacteroidetes bacterium]|nr:YdeI/OmpD-associated family protein [Bacteroidota bacterium]
MPKSVAEKLRIKSDQLLVCLHAPASFEKGLGKLPSGVRLVHDPKSPPAGFHHIHWFVQNQALLEKELPKVLKWLSPGVYVWVYYPKGSSNIPTDLTRDKGWDFLMSQGDKLVWLQLISFDDTWSVFGLRAQTDEDKKKAAKPKPEREIFNWVDPKNKTVRLPDDLALAFKKNKKESAFFDSLSFSNKKEYVEWIVTAKREETRKERISGTIERLGKQWKNPANR